MESSQKKRKEAIDLLASITSGTTRSDVANKKLSYYRKNYEIVNDKLNALDRATTKNSSASNDTEISPSYSNTDI